ncbi:MAG: recombinase family protein [Bacteriovoracaceae bacterium]|jgi:DNA invertase Pin-like site-specific DNA recombinase|nr:recombinase family protein [Bacteriovoracaceae bacterium]
MKVTINLKAITALYIRTSTDKQDNGADTQLNELMKFIEKEGITKYQIYEDKGVSGAKEKRPAFDLMKKDIRSGKIGSIITYSISRLGRKAHILTELRRLIDTKGVALIMLEENINTSTIDGNFIFHIHGAVAELNRDQIAKSTIAGLEEARRKGKVWGKPKTRPSEKIRKLHKKGDSLRTIAKKCNCSLGSVQAEIRLVKAGRDIIRWEKVYSEKTGELFK